jgi:hypothetical protein
MQIRVTRGSGHDEKLKKEKHTQSQAMRHTCAPVAFLLYNTLNYNYYLYCELQFEVHGAPRTFFYCPEVQTSPRLVGPRAASRHPVHQR